jgi:hypothetical protein
VSCEDFGALFHGVWLIVCFFFFFDSVVSVPGRRGSGRLNQQTIRERFNRGLTVLFRILQILVT